MNDIKKILEQYFDCELSVVEVYEDYFKYWNERERSMLIEQVESNMKMKVDDGTRWDDLTYDKGRYLIEYLKKKTGK